MSKETRKIWLVKHPLSLYKEDVKKLARTNDLKIVCSSQSNSISEKFLAGKTPELTLVKEPEVKKGK